MLCAYCEYKVNFHLSLLVQISCRFPFIIFRKDLPIMCFLDVTKYGVGGFCMIQGVQQGQPYWSAAPETLVTRY